MLSCLHTILEEEWEHQRYAVRIWTESPPIRCQPRPEFDHEQQPRREGTPANLAPDEHDGIGWFGLPDLLPPPHVIVRSALIGALKS